MPRFNSDKYNTAMDSSPGWKTYKPTYVVLLLAVAEDDKRFGCPCGCGGWPLGDKATFAMGHDARLRGILIRAHLMGKEILYVVRQPNGAYSDMPIMDPLKIADKYQWRGYLEAAVLKRDGKNREVAARAMVSSRLLQLGRWEYTDQVAAVYGIDGRDDVVEVEYVNRAGEIKRTRVEKLMLPVREGQPT